VLGVPLGCVGSLWRRRGVLSGCFWSRHASLVPIRGLGPTKSLPVVYMTGSLRSFCAGCTCCTLSVLWPLDAALEQRSLSCCLHTTVNCSPVLGAICNAAFDSVLPWTGLSGGWHLELRHSGASGQASLLTGRGVKGFLFIASFALAGPLARPRGACQQIASVRNSGWGHSS
jgi:hypothetical protein